MHQVFEQTNIDPYLPENLVWYHNESRWQQLYHQRLNGSILKDSVVISNQDISKGSASELNDLKASLEIAIFSMNASLKNEYKSKFNREEKTEWCFNVEFYPVNKQSNSLEKPNSSKLLLNDDEQKYIEELKFVFEDDGIIDEDEKRILERKRQKYGISEIRAIELEKQVTDKSHLIESEQEYQAEYLELLKENGEITENIKRILERLRLN
jgi:hypothetical protein